MGAAARPQSLRHVWPVEEGNRARGRGDTACGYEGYESEEVGCWGGSSWGGWEGGKEGDRGWGNESHARGQPASLFVGSIIWVFGAVYVYRCIITY